MGVLTDFFIASPEELRAVFRGWASPAPLLDEFVERTGMNPFTGAETVIRSRISDERVDADPDAEVEPDTTRFSLLDQKGLSTNDLVALSRAALDWDTDTASSEIYGRVFSGPEDAIGVLLEIPGSLTTRLAALTKSEHESIASRWAALFREDAATIEHPGIRAHRLERPNAEWAGRLAQLAELARDAIKNSRTMYMWMTP